MDGVVSWADRRRHSQAAPTESVCSRLRGRRWDGLEALTRATVFRERAEAYGVKAREAEKLTVLDSYPLALTDARLADDMDAVAKLKGYSITGPGPRCATT